MTSPLNRILKPLADAVTECGQKLPWCSGTWNVSPEDLKLYFDYGNETRSIRFPNATEAQLDELAEACQPATFGANQQDVLDENYRKAGKMDLDQFAINFNPERLGLTSAIKSRLLGWDDGDRSIVLEAYKLNVYGKGSFFKAHKDTPRGEKMFGSLVVILPTVHHGGGIVLRHNNTEMTFDCRKELNGKPPGTVAFIAFYSDVEHEVQQVTSGHRVTITYNLYFADEKAETQSLPLEIDIQAANRFSQSLKSILANPEFFPKGGLLGFGLKHQYPISSSPDGNIDLQKLLTCLKGEDAIVLHTCTEHSLSTSIKIIYKVRRWDGTWVVMCDRPFVDIGDQVEDVLEVMSESFGGVAIWGRVVDEMFPGYIEHIAETTWRKVVKWVTPMKSMTTHTSTFIAYGNQAALEYIYGDISLIVEVGTPGHRQDPSTIVQFDLKTDSVDGYNPNDLPDPSDISTNLGLGQDASGMAEDDSWM